MFLAVFYPSQVGLVPIFPATTDGARRRHLLGNVDSQRRYAGHLNTQANDLAESFLQSLKYEEVYRQEYRDLAEARASIRRFLQQVYNEKRLDSHLGLSPTGGIRGIARDRSPAQVRGGRETFRKFWRLWYEFLEV